MAVTELALIALVVLLVIALWWRRRRSGKGNVRAVAEDALDTIAAWPPEASRVLTTPEQRAYKLLVRNLPPGYAVLAQVPLSRFLRVPTRHSYREWMRRVGRLNADLLVCDSTFQVLCVVNVRPAEGKDSERGLERHTRMDRVLRKAGLRVLNWREGALPDEDLVRELVFGREQIAAMSAASDEASASATSIASQQTRPSGFESSVSEASVPEPLPSTFFDDLDSRPVPLPRPKSRE